MKTTVKEYLETLGREAIERVYALCGAPPYTEEADAIAAERLTRRAQEDGHSLQIGPTTLGRHRSRIGLVRRNPQPAPPPSVQDPAQEVLPGLGDMSRLLSALGAIRKQLDHIASALWAREKRERGELQESKPNGADSHPEAM